VPVAGVQPLAPAFDTVGWLTADPGTLEQVGDVLLPPGPVTPVRTALLAEDVTALADPGVQDSFTAAAQTLVERAGLALETVPALCGGRLDEWFAAFLLLPASSSPAPPLDMSLQVKEEVRAASLRLTCLGSLAGLPCVVLPLLSVDGLPAGLCAMGAFGDDRSLLRFANSRHGAAASS
jgi:Asp-tRNA(Asn)/Glu-tRNA(Gln) amidotransferase A subunit family amidase